MILYHGTSTHFEEFSNDFISTEDSIDQYGSGFYFYSNPAKTVLHGDLRVTAEVEIKKLTDHNEQWNSSYDDIESLIIESPGLNERLCDFGDIDYWGFDAVLNKTVNLYIMEDFFTDILSLIGNDFFAPKETHILLKKFVEITGIDCFTDLKREIYIVLTKGQIDIQSIIHEQDWEKEK